MIAPTKIPVAIRAYARRKKRKRGKPGWATVNPSRWPTGVVVLDVETTADALQHLLFGCYRFYCWTREGVLESREEGLFYADELPELDPEGYERLKEYAESRRADVSSDYASRLLLMSRAEFVERVLWGAVYRGGSLLVGFNLPFDLSRLAVGCGEARGRYRGGFSFPVWEYDPGTGELKERTKYRPRIRINHIDSTRSFLELSSDTQFYALWGHPLLRTRSS